MMFHRSLCILAVLANSPTGATAGQLSNRVGGVNCRMTKAQVESCLKHLVLDKYVIRESSKYRSNIDQKIYHITPLAVEFLRLIAMDYDNREKQLTLPVYQEKG